MLRYVHSMELQPSPHMPHNISTISSPILFPVFSLFLFHRKQSVTLHSFTAIMCPSLLDPANGEVQASDRSFGRVATYSCNEGYALMGSNSRRCQADARWSGEEPECLSKYHNVWTSGVLIMCHYIHLCPFLQLSVGI